MRKATSNKTYFFVDESGDPYFYDRRGKFIVGKEGCSKILILGFIKTEEPQKLRVEMESVGKEIEKDIYLRSVPSLKKSLAYFHATDDCPDYYNKKNAFSVEKISPL